MLFHRGRLFDHIHLCVRDLDASYAFYDAVIAAVGRQITFRSERTFAADELWVTDEGEPTGRMHFAFQADGRAAVDRFYEAGLAHGGSCNGPPGLRDYHGNYYSAYLLDPDGNNVEAVFHGPARRSVDSVQIEAIVDPSEAGAGD